jgi:membrane-associated phospholipid phosphatase
MSLVSLTCFTFSIFKNMLAGIDNISITLGWYLCKKVSSICLKLLMMKKVLSSQSAILIFATLIAFAITIYVGNFVVDTSTFYWNTLLINITFMGDAFFAFGLVLFLLFFFNKKKLAFNLILTILVTLVFVQIIKNIFNSQSIQFYFESGIIKEEDNISFYRNFISSHTALAFTLAIFFAKHMKKTTATLLLFITAILVSYSRIIIAEESLLALLLGLLPAACSFYLINKFSNKKESNKGYFYKSSRYSHSSLNNNSLLQI